MTNDDEQRLPESPKAKLPHARSYLSAAKWGLENMLSTKQEGTGLIFHLIAIAAVARAVPQVLIKSDRKLSDAHHKVIGEWAQHTKPAKTRAIHFLKTVRDLALKEGTLRTCVMSADIHINDTVIEDSYSVVRYDEQGKPQNMLVELREAFVWLEAELQQIEAQLPGAGVALT